MIIETHKLTRIFRQGRNEVKALDEVGLNIPSGSFALIKGPSGCGKSTLLFTLGGMLRPTSGDIVVDGIPLYQMSDRERTAFRSQHTGFVFQSYHLLPYLNVLENIMISRVLFPDQVTKEKALQLAGNLNLTSRLNHKPSELSSGEKQRVALARAFITGPDVIFADEPTGNLDPVNAKEVIEQLVLFHQNGGSVIMVSHGNEADQFAGILMTMKDGRIIHIDKN